MNFNFFGLRKNGLAGKVSLSGGLKVLSKVLLYNSRKLVTYKKAVAQERIFLEKSYCITL